MLNTATPITKDFERFLRIRDVAQLTGLSVSYLYALADKGQFPQSISLVEGGTSRAWLLSEVTDWMNGRVAARNNGGTV